MATLLEDQTSEGANSDGYDGVVFTRNTETIEAFSSWVISIKAEKAYTGECINVMTQVLWTEDSAPYPKVLPSKMCILSCRKVVSMLSCDGKEQYELTAKCNPKESSSGQGSSHDCSARNTTRRSG